MLSANEKARVRDGIEQHLRYEPTVETRNRKRLRPNPIAEWELRLGGLRILYDVDEGEHLVYVQAVGAKRGERFYAGGQEVDLHGT
ncbi:MAG: addiction module toxin RelE [Chloroflexi bacterium]|nr:addiction module toxin RelE [Chloroflexota bacterium]